MKSCKISEDNYNYLLTLDKSPNKALDRLRKKVIQSKEYYDLISKFNKLQVQVNDIQEVINQKSGGY